MEHKAQARWLVVAVAMAGVVVVVGATVGLSLFVWKSPSRINLATYWSFVAAVVAVSIVIVGGLYRWGASAQGRRENDAERSAALIRLTELLARTVQDQWTQAAMERLLLQPEPIPVRWQVSAKPFTNPAWAATDSRQFPPFPGIAQLRPGHLHEGSIQDLHNVYGGLGSGRLVIVGSPGSGKSGAAVLLLLAALRYRKNLSEQDRLKVPVPVFFTMNGWDPKREPVQEWLAGKLRQAYPFFAGRRSEDLLDEILQTGRIAVILDGLDEIPSELRATAIQALSRQALFRIVVLVRSEEMTAVAQLDLLQGAVALELQEVDPWVSADYLTRVQRDPAPPAWRELIDRLRHAPNSPLSAALNNPLTLTLLRDTYRRGNDAAAFLDFCDSNGCARSREEIEDHLLDRVLPVAYAVNPGDEPPRYDFSEAEKVLSYIASQMNRKKTRDLAWWRIPAWTSPAPSIIATIAISGVLIGLVAGLVAGLALNAADGWTFGFIGVAVGASTFGLVLGPRNQLPQQVALPRWKTIAKRNVWIFIFVGTEVDLLKGLAAGIAASLLTAVIVILTGAVSRPAEERAIPFTPVSSWRRDRSAGLLVGLTGGLACGLAAGLVFGFSDVLTDSSLVVAVTIGIVGGSTSGLIIGLAGGLMYSQSWAVSLSFIQLSMQSGTPIHLMNFLEDARERNVLRTVGPVYQFRHARLQDRLADHASGSANLTEIT